MNKGGAAGGFLLVVALQWAIALMLDGMLSSLLGAPPPPNSSRNWQLGQVPLFGKFLDQVFAGEGPRPFCSRLLENALDSRVVDRLKGGGWRIVNRRRMDELRCRYVAPTPSMQVLRDRFHEVVQDADLAKSEEARQPLEPPAKPSCLAGCRRKLAKAAKILGGFCLGRRCKRVKDDLTQMQNALHADIKKANEQAEECFVATQRENRKAMKREAGTSNDGEEKINTRKAREWTNIKLQPDEPNVKSSDKVLKHVKKECEGMRKEGVDHWEIASHWFLAFELVRQSGLPADQAMRLFSDEAKKSCKLPSEELRAARLRVHEDLALSRTWPLVREVSHAFLLATLEEAEGSKNKIYFPRGWSRLNEVDEKAWIKLLFSKTFLKQEPQDSFSAAKTTRRVYISFRGPAKDAGEYMAAVRLDPVPKDCCTINNIAEHLWRVNFLDFAEDFEAVFYELLDDYNRQQPNERHSSPS